MDNVFPGAFHAIAEDIRARHPSPPPCRAIDRRVGSGAARRSRRRASVHSNGTYACQRPQDHRRAHGFPNLVSVQIPVQTGSRNEVEPGKSGFAHFFEHLMFRGTPANPPEKYREIMGKAGARDNASTGDDYTQYYATFAKEHLEQVIALYADMFQNLAYSEADFKTEARAILGEYNKNSANPIQKLLEVQRDTYYRAHTYKHTTMGFITDIENMPNEYAYSKVFFERWYRPQNTAIVIAGDVTPDQVLQLVEKHWGGWKPGGGVTQIPKEPPPAGPLYVHVPWTSETLPYVTVAFPAPAFGETSKDSAAMDILAALYFGSTSELYKKLVVSEQKVDALDVDVPSSVDPSLFTIFARVKNPADALYVRDQILAHDFQRSRGADSRAAPDRRKVVQPLRIRPVARQHRAHRHDGGGVRVLSPVVRHGERLFPDARDRDSRRICSLRRASTSPTPA